LKKQITLRRWWVTALVACVVPVFLHAEANKHRTVVVISLDGFPAYALDDPRLPIPTLRKLAREGVAATSMRPVNPTVTWPNHTAIVTGVDASEHHVLFNGLLTRPDGGGRPSIEPWREKETMVHAPTIYDIAHQAGLTTAQVDWVAIYRAKTITWQFPELPDPNGVIERELIADKTVTAEQLRTFEDSSQAWQDEIWTAAAEEILEKHKPNLLLFHLLTLDDTNHEYGPMSPASFTAMAFLDAKVKQILDVLQRTGLSRHATLIVVSDHGFRSFKHKIHPNVLLRKKGLLSEGPGQPKGDAWVLSEGGTAVVYVTNPDRKASVVSELRNILTGAEGIDHIYGVEEAWVSAAGSDRSSPRPCADRCSRLHVQQRVGRRICYGSGDGWHARLYQYRSKNAGHFHRLGRGYTRRSSHQQHRQSGCCSYHRCVVGA
jgi:predicted AlkP superfamily pyrophosphatase or phosphodiesterase